MSEGEFSRGDYPSLPLDCKSVVPLRHREAVYTRPQTANRLSTNRARRRSTTMIDINTTNTTAVVNGRFPDEPGLGGPVGGQFSPFLFRKRTRGDKWQRSLTDQRTIAQLTHPKGRWIPARYNTIHYAFTRSQVNLVPW